MVRHGGSSAGSYLADPTSPIPSHCASIVVTSTLRVNIPRIERASDSSIAYLSSPSHTFPDAEVDNNPSEQQQYG